MTLQDIKWENHSSSSVNPRRLELVLELKIHIQKTKTSDHSLKKILGESLGGQ